MKPKTVTVYDPENDLYSDAMDRAASVFHSVRHGALRNAERAGENIDGETLMRRALAGAFKAFVEELPAHPTPEGSKP